MVTAELLPHGGRVGAPEEVSTLWRTLAHRTRRYTVAGSKPKEETMNRSFRYSLAVTAAALGVLLLVAGSAFAHP